MLGMLYEQASNEFAKLATPMIHTAWSQSSGALKKHAASIGNLRCILYDMESIVEQMLEASLEYEATDAAKTAAAAEKSEEKGGAA